MDNTVLDTIYTAKINFHYIDGSSFLLLSSCSMTIHESCFVPYSDFDMLIFAIRKILLIVLISALLNPLSAITPNAQNISQYTTLFFLTISSLVFKPNSPWKVPSLQIHLSSICFNLPHSVHLQPAPGL